MKQITASELLEWQALQKHFTLIDIREDFEREHFNIGGNHIPLGDLLKRIDEIPKNEDVVLYCEKGIRSVIAIQRLQEKGFSNLYNLSGGMQAWRLSQRG